MIGSLGRWDILVNNAAIALVKPFDTITESEFDLSFRVNVKGVFHGCQLAWRHLSEGGRIINLSSATTGLMLPGYGVYDATKGAVEQLTRILAKELGPRKITVNTVSPGATDTPNYRVGKSDEQIESQIAHNAIGRLGTVDDVAPVVAFLATDGARWVTGQNIRVNGGSS